MKPGLADIQGAFQRRVLAASDEILPMLANGGRFISVYEHAYFARLRDVLAEDFPALHVLLGDEEFAAATQAYVAANPSRHPSIRWFGAALPGWLAATEPWNAVPMLADMAAFEWTLGLAFDAPDATVIAGDTLASIPAETWHVLSFAFHPSVQSVALTWDVAPFRGAVVEEREPDGAPEPLDDVQTWVAWRDPESLVVRYDRIVDDEAPLLAAARDGASFGELCAQLAETGEPDSAAVRAATILKGWVDRGWIAGLAGNNASWA